MTGRLNAGFPARLRVLAALLLCLASLCVQTAGSAVPVLTNAAMVRKMLPARARMGVPVNIQATVTGLSPASPAIFLQDDSGGTFARVNMVPWPAEVQTGDLVEARGTSFAGRYVPGFDLAAIRVLGKGKMFATKEVTYDDLLSGRYHYERVEVCGIVRSVEVRPEGEPSALTVALGTRKLRVRLMEPAPERVKGLVDARVKIAGLATGYINDFHQLITPQILVSREEDIIVATPALAQASEYSMCNVSTLMVFTPEGLNGHRVRLQGTVTHQQPGRRLFLRDEQQLGLMVQTAAPGGVEPGDLVEVLGFPAMGRFSAFLDDAEYRRIGSLRAPVPLPVSIEEAMRGTNDANLVTLDAHLLEVVQSPAETTLVLRSGDIPFRARLPKADLSFRSGSELRVTGICRVEELDLPPGMFGAMPGSIELLLRSPADIVVHAAATWWTARRLAVVLGIAMLLATGALVWAVFLRRRVAHQAEVIRAKLRREAALEERHRVAREIHDTVAQSFSGLGFQLDALNARLSGEATEARKQLETARQIVRHGQESFRRSLMNLRAQELERGRFTEALPELARQVIAGSGIDLRYKVDGQPQGLPEAIENNLLRIAQECLTNAVRHARPGRIDLRLAFVPGQLKLSISDNGCGFDPAVLNQPAPGHFGWPGIKERAEQIRAGVELISGPGRGTTVTITAPI